MAAPAQTVTSSDARPDPPAEPPAGGGRVVVEGVEKTYGPRRALGGLTFGMDNGLVGLLGPNGAGKSTLMRCLAGIQSWDRGRIAIDGVDAEHHPAAVRRNVGFMPERVSFPAEMRTGQYLAYVAAAKGLRRGERAAAVDLAVTRAGLEAARRRIIGNLSKGYRQRVGLAQALLGDPAVVILDEPTAGLDPLNLLEIRSVLSDYAADHVVVLSTHTLSEARLLCDRLIVLATGSIVYDGPTAGLTDAGAEARRVRIRARPGWDPSAAGSTALGDAAAGGAAFEACVVGAGARVVRAATGSGGCDAVVEVAGAGAVAGLTRALVLTGWAVDAVEPLSDALEDAFRHAVRLSRQSEGQP